MGFNFPDTPALGAAFGNYIWDGEKWTLPTGGSGVPAAPFDALSYNGMQVNGACDVSQERGFTPITATGKLIDGFTMVAAGTMAVSVGLVADAPAGLSNSIKVTVTTAQASLGASDVVLVSQPIEGYRVARLAFGSASAQPVSFGFWTKIHRPGMYSGSVRNAAADRSYPFTFTQNVADAWEYKTVTVPGDVTGTWEKTNLHGLLLGFSVAAGTSRQAAANAWIASSFLAASGTTNGVAATSDTFQITGLVVLPGIYTPSAAQSPFIMRPYDPELLTCQRYFDSGMIMMQVPTNGSMIQSIPWHVRMRAVPTVTLAVLDPGSGTSPIVLNLASADTGAFQIPAAAANGYARSSYSADARL